LLKLSSEIVTTQLIAKSIDSLSSLYINEYRNFVPNEKDSSTYKYVKDFCAELDDFKKGRSNNNKLAYRQRLLVEAVSNQVNSVK